MIAACLGLLAPGCRFAPEQHSALSLEDVLEPYQGGVVAIDYSPDGKLLATAHSSVSRVGSRVHGLGLPPAFVKLWDVQERGNLATFRVEDGSHQAVRFAPDGKSLMVRSRTTLFRWDIEKQTLSTEMADSIVALSPDCRLVAGFEDDGHIPVINASDGTERTRLSVRPHAAALAFSPDSTLLAAGDFPVDGPKHVEIWNLTSEKCQSRMQTLDNSRHCCLFSPDGKFLVTATISDPCVSVWDTETGKLQARLGEYSESIWCLAFSPGGKLVASGSEGAEGGEIRLWDVNSGRQQGLVIDDSTWGITAMAFSADGTRLATGDGDGNIKVWKVAELRSE